MYRNWLVQLLWLAIITPLLVIALRKREKRNIWYVLLYAGFFLIGGLIRVAPGHFESIQFTHTMYNWSVKFYAMVFFDSICSFLVNRTFGNPQDHFGTKIGWGLTAQLKLKIDLFYGLFTVFSGFLIGWLRQRSGSLVLPIAVHNLGDLAISAASWIT